MPLSVFEKQMQYSHDLFKSLISRLKNFACRSGTNTHCVTFIPKFSVKVMHNDYLNKRCNNFNMRPMIYSRIST